MTEASDILNSRGGNMERYFNTEGRCRPDLHYMVRLDDRLRKMKEQFVDRGKYFVEE